MKTKEQLNQKYARGPVSLYDIYLEGYQDCKNDNEDNFRREAAKDILCAMIEAMKPVSFQPVLIEDALMYTRSLIEQLKQE